MSLLGIDIGTTGCKAAAFSSEGRLLAISYREYKHPNLPSGCSELDSQKVLENIWDCISDVAAKVKSDPVEALSISSLGEAMTPVTTDRKIIGNSILCSDVRGDEYVSKLSESITQQELYQINPNIMGANYSAPKLLWVKENNPEIYNRTYKFLLWADLVAYMLGAEPATTASLANRTMLFDINKGDWSEKLLTITGIDKDKLPAIVQSGTVLGNVSVCMAKRLGLSENVKIVAGAHDQCCNALGAGVVEQGQTVCGMGTFECFTPVYNGMPKHKDLLLRNGLNIEHHILPDRYVSFLYNQSGSLLRWFRDTFASLEKKTDTNIYETLIAEIPNKPTDILVLPHFEMTGPPKFISDSCGIILGLKTSTTRGEILKAIMECSTLYFVQSLNDLKSIGIETKEFIATGGGAKSDTGVQLRADILGVPFKRLKQPECGLAGAAMIAGMSINTWDSYLEAIGHFVQTEITFEPDAQKHLLYTQKHEDYKKLYPCFKNIYQTTLY